MAETFTKLLSSITDSSIWMEDSDTRIVWVTLLAMANYRGYVAASIPGIAARARVPLDVAERAIERFQQPDKYSRSVEHEGRRIAREDRGWLLLNHAKIKAERHADFRREYNRIAQQKHRAGLSAAVSSGQQSKPPSAHSESDTDTESEDREGEGEHERELPLPSAAPTPPTRQKKPRSKSAALVALKAALKAEMAKRRETAPALSHSLGQKAALRVSEHAEAFGLTLDQAAAKLAASWALLGGSRAWSLCDVPFEPKSAPSRPGLSNRREVAPGTTGKDFEDEPDLAEQLAAIRAARGAG